MYLLYCDLYVIIFFTFQSKAEMVHFGNHKRLFQMQPTPIVAFNIPIEL